METRSHSHAMNGSISTTCDPRALDTDSGRDRLFDRLGRSLPAAPATSMNADGDGSQINLLSKHIAHAVLIFVLAFRLTKDTSTQSLIATHNRYVLFAAWRL